MSACVYTLAAVATIALSACELSQSKPEMVRTVLPRVDVPDTRGTPADEEREGGAPRLGITNTERSIRLYGPGVSRKRQTRV